MLRELLFVTFKNTYHLKESLSAVRYCNRHITRCIVCLVEAGEEARGGEEEGGVPQRSRGKGEGGVPCPVWGKGWVPSTPSPPPWTDRKLGITPEPISGLPRYNPYSLNL